MTHDKQLTPEEYAYKLFPIEEGNIEDDINAYKRRIFLEGFKYAGQQTTAKDEEIKQLKADREKYATQKVKDACNDRDEIMRQLYKNEMAAKDERIKELEEQRKILIEHHNGKDLQINIKDARIAELEKEQEKTKNLALEWFIANSERDQAFHLLRRALGEDCLTTSCREAIKTLLSSRENKKP